MRVQLADSRPRVRFALRALLEEQPEVWIVGEATHSRDLLAQVETICPDLLLLSWELPGRPGEDLLVLLRRSCPQLYVIILSGRRTARQVVLAAGADAFVSKIAPPEELLAAIEAVGKTKSASKPPGREKGAQN